MTQALKDHSVDNPTMVVDQEKGGEIILLPRPFEAMGKQVGREIVDEDIMNLTGPKLIGDVLDMSINAFGTGQSHFGSGPRGNADQLISHHFKGFQTWKPSHEKAGADQAALPDGRGKFLVFKRRVRCLYTTSTRIMSSRSLLLLIYLIAAITADSTTGVGDYINAGLGGSSSTLEANATVYTSSSYTNSTSFSSTSTSVSPSSNDERYATTSFSYAPTGSPSAPITYLWSNLSMMALTGTNANYSITTFSLDPAAPCWTQWEQYWSASSINEHQDLEIQVPITTIETYYNNSAVVGTYTTMTSNYGTATHTDFTVLSDGNYAYSTSYDTSTTTLTMTGSFYTDISTDTANYEYYETSTYSQFSRIGKPYTNVYKPNCSLPQYVPQCQSKWSSWIMSASDYDVSKYSKPGCTHADIAGSLCSSLVSTFMSDRQYSLLGPITSSIPWPTHTTFAPGCTLGCQTCAVTGDKVQLLYWPPATSATFIDGNSSRVVAPTQAPSDSPVVVSYGGTQLTSPTIYISYHLLYASDSCGPVGPTIRDTIVPLTSSADLASIQWDFLSFDNQWMTESFNFTDLIEPIPQSVYNKQPICASQAVSWLRDSPSTASGISALRSFTGTGDDWWSLTSNFDCPRTGPYRPIIAMPAEVSDFAPEWSSCTVWYGGLYDPPKALQSQSIAAIATMPAACSTTPASPSSTMPNTQPLETASLVQTFVPSADTEPTSSFEPSPASFSPSTEEAGSSELTSTQPVQDAGGAIFSIIASAASASDSEGITGATSAFDPTSASTIENTAPGSGPSDDPTLYSDPADPAATYDSSGSAGILSPGASTVIGSRTLQPGQVTAISGVQYSMDTGGAIVTASESENALSVLSSAEQSARQTIDPEAAGTTDATLPYTVATKSGLGATSEASNKAVLSAGVISLTAYQDPSRTEIAIISGTTLSIGGPALTLSGSHVVSLAPDGLADAEYTARFTSIGNAATAATAATASAQSMTYTAVGGSGQFDVVVMDGTTASLGGPALTLSDGSTVSLGSSGLNDESTTIAVPTVPSESNSIPSTSATAAGQETSNSQNAAATDNTRYEHQRPQCLHGYSLHLVRSATGNMKLNTLLSARRAEWKVSSEPHEGHALELTTIRPTVTPTATFTRAQSDSYVPTASLPGFLRLPPELRNIVYDLTLPDREYLSPLPPALRSKTQSSLARAYGMDDSYASLAPLCHSAVPHPLLQTCRTFRGELT
ncbi:hypothetical protein LTR27_008053 [Elasticomyces elasticus]|nr:hypothetical protein LTR27_008053 [Elasticomyces elasticus]